MLNFSDYILMRSLCSVKSGWGALTYDLVVFYSLGWGVLFRLVSVDRLALMRQAKGGGQLLFCSRMFTYR